MKFQEIEEQHRTKLDNLMSECHVFWAFSNEQFKEGRAKHPLKEGEKYVSIGMGGFIPKSNVESFISGQEAITKWKKEAIKKNKQQTAEITYQLSNHECYYTGDIDTVVEMFEGIYTREQIQKVYNTSKAKAYENL